MKSKDSYRIRRNTGVWIGLILLFMIRFLWAVPFVAIPLWVIGVALLLWGCWNWTKFKGRSGWWMLWGLLAPIGLIALAVLKDKYVERA
ncbi:hypothetical protein ES708_05661 [subsurface metagenome]